MVTCVENGVPVAPVGGRFFAENAALLARYPGSRQAYFPDGAVVTEGAVELCRIFGGAPKARITDGGLFYPENCRSGFWL
jgi:hypothetical protein